MNENELSKVVYDLCIKIHTALGPGLLESAYEDCLEYEFKKLGIPIQRQVMVPLVYDQQLLGDDFRADMIVDNKVILELKAVTSLDPICFSQLKTYLKITGLKLGMLINFGEDRVVKGIHRVVNGL